MLGAADGITVGNSDEVGKNVGESVVVANEGNVDGVVDGEIVGKAVLGDSDGK